MKKLTKVEDAISLAHCISEANLANGLLAIALRTWIGDDTKQNHFSLITVSPQNEDSELTAQISGGR
jgi:hypothetical protein